MKRFGKALLICLMGALLSVVVCVSGSEAAKSKAKPLEITVDNVSSRSVALAFAAVNKKNKNESIVKGWYTMRSGVVLETKTFKPFNYNPNYNYYYYGYTGRRSDVYAPKGYTKGYTLEGESFYGWVHPKKGFTIKNDQQPDDEVELRGFRPLKVSSDGTAKLTFDR